MSRSFGRGARTGRIAGTPLFLLAQLVSPSSETEASVVAVAEYLMSSGRDCLWSVGTRLAKVPGGDTLAKRAGDGSKTRTREGGRLSRPCTRRRERRRLRGVVPWRPCRTPAPHARGGVPAWTAGEIEHRRPARQAARRRHRGAQDGRGMSLARPLNRSGGRSPERTWPAR